VYRITLSQTQHNRENVCVDRFEEDEGSSSDFEELTDSIEMDTSSIEEGPLFSVKLSACENLHSSYKCVTHLIGGGLNSTVTTTYKCCHGYILDKQAGECFKGI